MAKVECLLFLTSYEGRNGKRRQKRWVITEEKTTYDFCVLKGIPKEEIIADGIYVGRVTSVRKDKNGNPFPIVGNRYQLTRTSMDPQSLAVEGLFDEEIAEIAASLMEVARDRRWIALSMFESLLRSLDYLWLATTVKILELMDDDVFQKFSPREEELFGNERYVEFLKKYFDLEVNEVLEKLQQGEQDENVHQPDKTGDDDLF